MIANDLLKYISVDLPNIDEITDVTREENARRIFTGGVRIDKGLYRTKKEDEEYRKKILQTELP